jgi:predicted AAA+ superfamily ATPase
LFFSTRQIEQGQRQQGQAKAAASPSPTAAPSPAAALAASGYPLFYWQSGNTAEIDFVLQKDGAVIPLEVKAGTNTKSRSLSVFAGKYHPPWSIRVSAKNFGFENGIKSVPLYAVFCV